MGYPGKIVKVKVLSHIKFNLGFYQTRHTLLYVISWFAIPVYEIKLVIRLYKIRFNYCVKQVLFIVAIYLEF